MQKERHDTYVGKSAIIKEAMGFAKSVEQKLSPNGLSDLRRILEDPVGREIFLDALGVLPIKENPK